MVPQQNHVLPFDPFLWWKLWNSLFITGAEGAAVAFQAFSEYTRMLLPPPRWQGRVGEVRENWNGTRKIIYLKG